MTNDSEPADRAAFGARLKLAWPGRTSLSAKQWWSGFDDYLELQKILSNHQNTILEKGRPENGLGATIAFDYEGGTTREILVEKDDVNHIWKISMPEPNPTFLFYEGTARIHSEDETGCDVSYEIDFVLSSPQRAVREAILGQEVPKNQPTRVDELSRYVLNRDGVKNQFTFPINCPLEDLWAAVGDWNGVGWVQGAARAEVLPNGRRTIYMENGVSFEERLWGHDDKTCTLVYEPILGPMPVRMYMGTVQLQAISAVKTQVNYTQVFIPKDGGDQVVLKAQLADAFLGRFCWLQQKFNKCAS